MRVDLEAWHVTFQDKLRGFILHAQMHGEPQFVGAPPLSLYIRKVHRNVSRNLNLVKFRDCLDVISFEVDQEIGPVGYISILRAALSDIEKMFIMYSYDAIYINHVSDPEVAKLLSRHNFELDMSTYNKDTPPTYFKILG